MNHFGINIRKKNNKLSRENYVKVNNRSSTGCLYDSLFLYEKYENFDREFLIKFLDNCIAELNKAIENNQYETLPKPKGFYRASSEKLKSEYLEKLKFVKNLKEKDNNESYNQDLSYYLRLYDLSKSAIGKIYTDEWCEIQKINALKNFDINIQHFKELEHCDFENELQKFLKKYSHFKPINDLKDVYYEPGYYLLVLDEYKMIYIGKSSKIGWRIVKHWSQDKVFDRLIFPVSNVENSLLSIDSFQALDTTRIFAWVRESNRYIEEDRIFNNIEFDMVNSFPAKFRQNRTFGGGVGIFGHFSLDDD